MLSRRGLCRNRSRSCENLVLTLYLWHRNHNIVKNCTREHRNTQPIGLARAVFILERGQRNRQTDLYTQLITLPIPELIMRISSDGVGLILSLQTLRRKFNLNTGIADTIEGSASVAYRHLANAFTTVCFNSTQRKLSYRILAF